MSNPSQNRDHNQPSRRGVPANQPMTHGSAQAPQIVLSGGVLFVSCPQYPHVYAQGGKASRKSTGSSQAPINAVVASSPPYAHVSGSNRPSVPVCNTGQVRSATARPPEGMLAAGGQGRGLTGSPTRSYRPLRCGTMRSRNGSRRSSSHRAKPTRSSSAPTEIDRRLDLVLQIICGRFRFGRPGLLRLPDYRHGAWCRCGADGSSLCLR